MSPPPQLNSPHVKYHHVSQSWKSTSASSQDADECSGEFHQRPYRTLSRALDVKLKLCKKMMCLPFTPKKAILSSKMMINHRSLNCFRIFQTIQLKLAPPAGPFAVAEVPCVLIRLSASAFCFLQMRGGVHHALSEVTKGNQKMNVKTARTRIITGSKIQQVQVRMASLRKRLKVKDLPTGCPHLDNFVILRVPPPISLDPQRASYYFWSTE